MRIWLDLFNSQHGPHGFVYCNDPLVVQDYLKQGSVEELAIDSFDYKAEQILDWLAKAENRGYVCPISLRPTITSGIHPPHDKIQLKIDQLKKGK